MLFGTAKRLNKFKERQLNIKVGETSINCTTQYKYVRETLDPSLTLDTDLDITCKREQEGLTFSGAFAIPLTRQQP